MAKNQTDGQFPIDVEHRKPVTSQYSNNLLVQFDGDSMFFHFFQVIPPITIVDDKVTPLESRQSLKTTAVPVASIVTNLRCAQEFVDAIQWQLDLLKAGQSPPSK
jgi:hypothetical protein